MKGIYRMSVECGRSGTINGIFSATKEEVKELLESGADIYFGEVLGKHSEVVVTFDSEDDLELVTDDPVAVEMFVKYGMATGYNPFDYFSDADESEDEDEDEDESDEEGEDEV